MIQTYPIRVAAAFVGAIFCGIDADAQVPAVTRETPAAEQELPRRQPGGLQLQAPRAPQPQVENVQSITVARFRFAGATTVEAAVNRANALPIFFATDSLISSG